MDLKRLWSEHVAKAPSERRSGQDAAPHNAQRQTPSEDAPVAGTGADQASAGGSDDAAGGGARQ